MLQEQAPDSVAEPALQLTRNLLFAFAAFFFLYHSLDAMNNEVFSMAFVPYHLSARLLADGNLGPLTDYSDTGGLYATRGPFLDYFRSCFPSINADYALRWIYLPAYVWIFRPLAGLEFPAAARAWLAVNIVLTLASLWLLWSASRRRVENEQLTKWRMSWFIFLFLTFQPMLSNLWYGQITGLMFACFCLSYWLLRRHPFAAGLTLGLITLLKFYPLLFALYFTWRREWRVVLGVAVGISAILLLSLSTAGWEGHMAYARMLSTELGTGGVAALNNQSLSGFLLHAFSRANVFDWRNVEVPAWLTGLRAVLVLALAAAAVWVMRRFPPTAPNSAIAQDLDLSLVICVMLLVSPVTWYHYYMWLLVPLVCAFDYLLLRLRENRVPRVLLAISYGLVVVQGISVLGPLAGQALQEVWVMRLLLSQNFLGAVLLTLLILRLRNHAY